MHIPENEILYNGYSTVDSFGRVFCWKNKILRGLNSGSISIFKELVSSGLLEELIDKKLIPNTYLSSYNSDKYQLILAHDLISPVTFVYEWSFNMIKAAGNCILEVNYIALKYGYETKDAHPYNILFNGCKPIFVDIGSLRKINKKSPWQAAGEFLSYYHHALKVWNGVNHNMARRLYADDINIFTLYEYKRLLYKNSLLYRISNFISTRIVDRLNNKIFSYSRSNELLKHSKRLKNFEKNKIHTKWENYHDDYVDLSVIKISDRFKFIIEKIQLFKIDNLTELAGNWGLLSYLILKQTSVQKIICTDFDENAVQKMFDFFANTPFVERLNPVLIDFIKPVELINSGKPSKRLKSDAVLALAITHHLILTNNYSIDIVLEKISEFTNKYAFVEFMPMGLWDGHYAPPLPSWYNQEWFEKHMNNFFEIVEVNQIEQNRILFIGMKRT